MRIAVIVVTGAIVVRKQSFVQVSLKGPNQFLRSSHLGTAVALSVLVTRRRSRFLRLRGPRKAARDLAGLVEVLT